MRLIGKAGWRDGPLALRDLAQAMSMTNPVNIGITSGLLWFTLCFRFRFLVLLMLVDSTKENQEFSFPETEEFNFPRKTYFIFRKRYISIPRRCSVPGKKEQFNLPGIACLISRKYKFQSPENWSIVISWKWHISISLEWHISIYRKWNISISWVRQILISWKLKYFTIPKMRYFNLPKMTHFNLSTTKYFNLLKTEVL